MKNTRYLKGRVRVLLAIASLIIAADSCHYGADRSMNINTQVDVYEDANANGTFDSEEKTIPNVTITFMAGSLEGINKNGLKIVDDVNPSWDYWMAVLSDNSGQAIFSGQVKPYVEIGALTPCGYDYKEISPGQFSDKTPIYNIGFIPNKPRTGSSAIELHIWLDNNADGEQQKNEMDFSGQFVELNASSHPYIVVDPRGPAPYTFYLRTDSSGKVKLELGNVCEKFETGNILGWGNSWEKYRTTYLSPNVTKNYSVPQNELYSFEFDVSIGITSIEGGGNSKITL